MVNATGNPCDLIPAVDIAYRRKDGVHVVGDTLKLLRQSSYRALEGRVQLIITSPPFPLNNKKNYGNLRGEKYLDWFISLAPIFSKLLTDDGSIIIELGNAWESRRPVQSLLPVKALTGFVESNETNLRLIQQFVCYNPSRLPSPAQWVTVNRIRAVDSFTHVWWIAKSDFPKASNERVLRPYSKSMQALIKRGNYNSGSRPSEHIISETGFLKDNGGAISHNFFELEDMDANREVRLPNAFSFANTSSNDFFTKRCKELGVTPHPARMPMGLASYFINFLTEEDDTVLDPFAGSNTTGFAAALNGRKWISFEINEDYVDQSRLRFDDPALKETDNPHGATE